MVREDGELRSGSSAAIDPPRVEHVMNRLDVDVVSKGEGKAPVLMASQHLLDLIDFEIAK